MSSASSLPPNRFFLGPRKGKVFEWPVPEPAAENPPESDYFGKALAEFNRIIGDRGLSVYLTFDYDNVPELNERTVIVAFGDEQGRVPRHHQKFLACFKCYGITPHLATSLSTFRYYGAISRLQHLRNVANSIKKDGLGWQRKRRAIRNVFPFPIGYFMQEEVPFVPYAERSIDVFFVGGRTPTRRSLGGKFILSAKDYSRESLFHNLDVMRERQPQIAYKVAESHPTARAWPFDDRTYSEVMMDTKIAIIPRGNNPETYRFFEAARTGSVMIREPLPRFPYYQNAPGIVLEDWSKLEQVVLDLLADPDLLLRLHQETLAYYHEVASPAAAGRYMAECLSPLLD